MTVVTLVTMSLLACGGERTTDRAQTMVVASAEAAAPPEKVLALPKRPGSIRFAAIGDAGRGDTFQHQVAATMAAFREAFEFSFVVMLGDNVYDGGTPEDYRLKFERPYEAFLEDEVKFYAVIGNHDDPNQP